MKSFNSNEKNIESKMKTSCLKRLEIIKKKPKYTEEDLEKFRIDSKHNPKTGREISENGKIYKQLRKELEYKDNIHTSQNIQPRLIIKKLKPNPPNLQN
jgi:hypothetical protein